MLDVKDDSVRTASARRIATSAARSASGATIARAGEPYSRDHVRQSPWISTTTAASLRARLRPANAASAS
jgi:hypothetical protein